MKKTIVFLHGYLESSDIWEEIISELEVNCLCPDLLGHGANKSDQFCTVEEMSDGVFGMLNQRGISNYSVVGHSMGGYVALDLLEHDPRCQKVVLLNSNFWEDSPEKKQDRLRVVEAVKHNKNRFIREVIPNLFANPEEYESVIQGLVSKAEGMSAEAISNASLAMRARPDKTSLVLKKIKDVIIIQGAYDNVMPSSLMRSMAPKGIALEVLDCGHMSWCESKDKTVQLIKRYLI